MGYNYTRFPAPAGACPVCWHNHGKMISDLNCDRHIHAERGGIREKGGAGEEIVSCEL